MVPKKQIQKWSRIAVAALLLIASFAPIFSRSHVGAYALPTDRFIRMSSSAYGSHPDGDGDNVTYQVGFTTNQGGAASNIGGIVVEFCDDSPIIGDSCGNINASENFDLNEGAGLAIANQVGITGWTIDAATVANRLILTRTPGSIAQNLDVTFDINGITNPDNVNTTFYARIITFTTNAGAQNYVSNNIEAGGTAVDAGGVALSTAAQITITARVPERITFCVFTNDDSTAPNTCGTGVGATGDLGGTAVTLGDTNGVLDFTGPFVDKNAKYSIATNASANVAIHVKGPTLKLTPACADGAGQNCSIDPNGSPGSASVPGTEQFGFCTYESAGTPSAGSGGLTADVPYNSGSCNTTTQTAGTGGTGGAGATVFAFDDGGTGTNSTYGDLFATKTPGVFSTGVLAFIGNISLITEPGVYSTTLTFIATGTY